MHIPDDPRYYEKFYFTPGDLDFVAHSTSRGSIGALVCWDQWFPEAARLTAMAGAQILFYPTAIGWWHGEPEKVRPKQVNAWETIQRSHAIANGVFVAAVNRVGVEGELEFWGNSFVADPFGEVIARASATAEETLVVECDLAKIEQVRRNWPFLRDRRIDAYADLTRRYRFGSRHRYLTRASPLLAAYRMPASGGSISRVYLAWPHNRDTWPGKFEVIPPIYAEMVAKIARFKPGPPRRHRRLQIDEVRATIRDAARRTETEAPGPLLPSTYFICRLNDAWARDHGPIFRQSAANARSARRIKSRSTGASTGGAKYGAFDLDDVVPQKLAAASASK